MVKPNWERIAKESLRLLDFFTEELNVDDFNPVDIPRLENYYNARNLSKWARTQKLKKHKEVL